MNGRAVAIGALKALGYLTFFVVATALFTVLTFPTEAVREFAEAKATALTGGKASIGELDLSAFGGVTLQDVSLRFEPIPPRDDMPGMAPPTGKPLPRILQAKRLAADVALLPLLLGGEKSVAFEAEVQGGQVTGGKVTEEADGRIHIEIGRIDGVRLGPAQAFKSFVGYQVKGLLSGHVDVRAGQAPEDLRGVVDVALRDAIIESPMIPTKQLGPLQLTDLHLGELQLRVRIDKLDQIDALKRARGRSADVVVVHLEDVGAVGDDVEIEFDDQSHIQLAPGKPLGMAKIDVHFAVHFKDAYLDRKVPDPSGGTTQPNKILRMAMRSDARLRAATRDGVIGITCKGLLSKPDCTPERPRIRGGFKERRPKFGGTEEEPLPQAEAPKPPATEEPKPAAARAPAAAPGRPAPGGRLKEAPGDGESNRTVRTGLERTRPAPAALRGRDREKLPLGTLGERGAAARERLNTRANLIERPIVPLDEANAEEDLPPEGEEDLPLEGEELLEEEVIGGEERLDSEEDLPPEGEEELPPEEEYTE